MVKLKIAQKHRSDKTDFKGHGYFFPNCNFVGPLTTGVLLEFSYSLILAVISKQSEQTVQKWPPEPYI